MFNLVTVIIAVALIAIVAITGYYYGGDAMNNGTVAAEAARYRNEAAQIATAVVLYRAKGNVIGEGFTLETLVNGGYLSNLPMDWEPGTDIIMKTLDQNNTSSEEICYTANKQASYIFSSPELDPGLQTYSLNTNYGIPFCDKSGLSQQVPCCVNP